MTTCIFCQIAQKKTETPLTYEDDQIVVFDDIYPKAPQHKLIIPKQHIPTLNNMLAEHQMLLGHMLLKAKDIAYEIGIAEKGYRTLINCNEDGGQVVFHLHLHLLGGRKLNWPPG